MANLKDLIVNGSARILGTIFGNLVGNVTGNCSGSSGSCTGNSATATTLQNTRTINGTNFNGSANITTTNWGTARNISISDSDGTNTGTAVSVNGSGNATLKLPATIKANITGNCSGSSGSCTGNANTATTATTATKIKVIDHSSNNATYYPLWATAAGNSMDSYVTTGKLKFNPSTGVLTSTSFAGNLTGNVTGNCSGSSGSCTGNAATATTATKLGTSTVGGTYIPVYLNAGVPTAVTVLTKTGTGALDWGSSGTTGERLVTAAGIAFWNGAYSNTSSNLTYCTRGKIVGTGTTADTTVGSTSQPVYIASNGTATVCNMNYQPITNPSQQMTGDVTINFDQKNTIKFVTPAENVTSVTLTGFVDNTYSANTFELVVVAGNTEKSVQWRDEDNSKGTVIKWQEGSAPSFPANTHTLLVLRRMRYSGGAIWLGNVQMQWS